MEELSDGDGIGHDLLDLHPPATLGADRHVDGEDPGQKIRPADAARGLGRFAEFLGKSWSEAKRELELSRRVWRRRDDPSAKAKATGADSAPAPVEGGLDSGSQGYLLAPVEKRWIPPTDSADLAQLDTHEEGSADA